MPRKITILGLEARSLEGWTARRIYETGEVWTLNDWYVAFPTVKRPSRVYNIHPPPFRHPSPRRYLGDWRSVYNLAIERGATIWTAHEIDGLAGQCTIPKAEILRRFPVTLMNCQICVMLLHAVLEGDVERITLLGCGLTEDEYRYQALAISECVAEARAAGIEVVNPYEADWASRKSVVDWANIAGAIKPYWEKAIPTEGVFDVKRITNADGSSAESRISV